MFDFSLPRLACLAAFCCSGCSLDERGLGDSTTDIEHIDGADASTPARDASRTDPPATAKPNAPAPVEAAVAEPTEPLDAGDEAAPADAADGDAEPDAEVELCPDADDSEPAMEIAGSSSGQPPSGPYEVVVEVEPSLSTHTIYRPRELQRAFPVVVWENGACGRSGLVYAEFLQELSSYGFVTIVSGQPYGTGTALGDDGAALVQAMDWAEAENERPCGKYFGKLDTRKVAALGASCGGAHALAAGADARVSTLLLFSTGNGSQSALNALHQPIAYLVGGSGDVAYNAADNDYRGITKGIAVFNASLDVGSAGTFFADNGGEFAEASVAWLRWRLLGVTGIDTSGQFEGDPCGLAQHGWTVKKKNMK